MTVQTNGFEVKFRLQPTVRQINRAPNKLAPAAESGVKRGRFPRITQVLAMALQFQEMICKGEIRRHADLARLGCVSRERISQMMVLTWLAPDIQEAILRLPQMPGGRLSDCALRTVWCRPHLLQPGCKADCCLILEGEQGIRKSTALRALAQPWFTDEIADLGSKDAALQTRGVWVIEIAELASMSRSDVGKIKVFMSRMKDRFRPPYGKRPIDSPRQCLFAGSVNHGTYLRDETGGRRFWPVHCKAPVIDVGALADSRDQLWAEAAHLYFDGKPWWLDSVVLNREATEEQADRYDGDPWDDLILAWAESRESVSIPDVLSLCLEKKKDMWTQWDRNRVARCLRAHGWERFNAGPRHAREWRYRRPLAAL